MINFHDVTKGNIIEHNPNWSHIPNHPNRISLIGGFRFGKKSYYLI